MIPEPFDWEDESLDEVIDCLDALTEEETYYRGFSRADIAKANRRIRASRRLEP